MNAFMLNAKGKHLTNHSQEVYIQPNIFNTNTNILYKHSKASLSIIKIFELKQTKLDLIRT